MNLSIGIVGLPNVGKSTLFNALVKGHHLSRHASQGEAKAGAKVSNFPFCTIEPNIGVVEVPDERLLAITKLQVTSYKLQVKTIPASIKFIDIAGLVKNAHKGEGLGNQFLAHIRECDAIIHIFRDFLDPNITHIAGQGNAKDDIETIKTELELADLETTEKQKNKETKEQKDSTPLNLLTSKPVIYVANVAEKDVTMDPEKIKEKYLIPKTYHLIPISAKLESELLELPEEEQKEYLETLGLKQSALIRLIKECYQLLGLITYYTIKPDQVQAWALHSGETALRASGQIHTDFAKGFIAAEVVSYEDFIRAGGWKEAQEKGLMRKEGKDYPIKDGDLIHFLFNV